MDERGAADELSGRDDAAAGRDDASAAAVGRERGRLPLLGAFASVFAALRHRNYRLFFFGQLVSLVGTWMQWTAQGWLVYKITGSKLMLGTVRMAGTLPLAVFSLFGGVIADRFPRRTILIVTQSAAMVLPLALAALVFTDTVRVWHIALLAAALGVVNAFDIPTRQAFVIEMVGREDLMNAIGLNSGVFNSARIIGPAVAGITMASVGVGFCFLINGLSYAAIIVGLAMMKVRVRAAPPPVGSVWRRIVDGFAYVRSDRRVMGLFGLLGVVGVFGFSYVVLLPAFARDVFGVAELGYAEMLTFNGMGAVVGSLVVASVGKRKSGRRNVLFIGVLVFVFSVLAFSFTGRFALALVTLPFVGMGMIMFFSTANTLIQRTVPDAFRGRVMGIWTLVFGGAMPLGGMYAGVVAESVGAALAVRIGAGVCAVAALVAALVGGRMRSADESSVVRDDVAP